MSIIFFLFCNTIVFSIYCVQFIHTYLHTFVSLKLKLLLEAKQKICQQGEIKTHNQQKVASICTSTLATPQAAVKLVLSATQLSTIVYLTPYHNKQNLTIESLSDVGHPSPPENFIPNNDT